MGVRKKMKGRRRGRRIRRREGGVYGIGEGGRDRGAWEEGGRIKRREGGVRKGREGGERMKKRRRIGKQE